MMMLYPDGVIAYVGALRVRLFIMPSLVFPFLVDPFSELGIPVNELGQSSSWPVS